VAYQPVKYSHQAWSSLAWDQVEPSKDSDQAVRVFKRSIRVVEIELFSFCNRRCWFCPNAYIDRITKNHFMPDWLYYSILDQLGSIDYNGKISYSRYNEPLANGHILLALRAAREKVPNAELHTNTNGDYLTTEYFADLYDAGLRSLKIQVYLQNEQSYDHELIKSRAKQNLDKWGLPYKVTRDEPDNWYECRLTYKDMRIRMYGRNFATQGTNRGGLVDIKQDYVRTSPCLLPFQAVYIDYNGKVVPCCNIRSDAPGHEDYVLADLSEEPNLFAAFSNERSAAFRKSLLNERHKQGLCGSCFFALQKVTDERREKMLIVAGDQK